MHSVRNILVPIDFSLNSTIVLRHAIQIAKKANAQITVFHAYSRPVVNRGKGKSFNFDKEGAEEKKLLCKLEKKIDYNFEMLAYSIPELKDIKTSYVKKRGLIVDLIVELAKQHKIDMIIMGTRGARGIDEIWGTKAADVSLEVKVPVLIMPYESQIKKHAKIALAYDFEKIKDFKPLNSLRLLAEVYDAEVQIINISDEDINSGKSLDEIQNYLKGLNVSLHLKKHSDVEEGLGEHIQHHDVSVLVVLHRSRNFLMDLFHDSLTERMALRSRIPILVLEV